jgi:hypothetical protein
MSPQATALFGPPLIGQAEKALNAILARELEGSGLSETGWVLLRLTAGAGGRLGREALIERAGAVSKFASETADAEIDGQIEAGYLKAVGGEVVLTAIGRGLQGQVRSAVGEVTTRLWGDLPDADLAIAGRVLGTVLSRANAELGYSI